MRRPEPGMRAESVGGSLWCKNPLLEREDYIESTAADALREREGVEHHDGTGAEQAPGRPIGRDDLAGSGLRVCGTDFHDRFLNGHRFDAQQAAVRSKRQEE